jgi:hypothetical protein
MTQLIPERMTASLDGDVVVFLIGMRVNSWWRVHQWLPMARAMRRMVRELEANPELGLLARQSWFSGRIPIDVQYWRSVDHLMAYAHGKSSEHLPAWRDFNRRMKNARGGVGIWHETYLVPAGNHETIYRNMPRFGLGRAGELVEATGRRETARGRLRAA